MNLAAVMDDLGAALTYTPAVLDEEDPEIVVTPARGIEGLRVYPYWVQQVSPPAAVVAWPDPLTFDSTFARGADGMEIPVIVLAGQVDSRTSRDVIAAYADGTGDGSVKAAIESYEATSYDSARVNRVEFAISTVAGVEYLAATFYIDILGKGA